MLGYFVRLVEGALDFSLYLLCCVVIAVFSVHLIESLNLKDASFQRVYRGFKRRIRLDRIRRFKGYLMKCGCHIKEVLK